VKNCQMKCHLKFDLHLKRFKKFYKDPFSSNFDQKLIKVISGRILKIVAFQEKENLKNLFSCTRNWKDFRVLFSVNRFICAAHLVQSAFSQYFAPKTIIDCILGLSSRKISLKTYLYFQSNWAFSNHISSIMRQKTWASLEIGVIWQKSKLRRKRAEFRF